MTQSLHILDFGEFTAKNVWNSSQSHFQLSRFLKKKTNKKNNCRVFKKNVTIGLQLQPVSIWIPSASHLINRIINLNLLPQNTNKAKFSLCRHKSGTAAVIWHWRLHTGSQAAMFPPTHQPGQSQASIHVALCLLSRAKLEDFIISEIFRDHPERAA